MQDLYFGHGEGWLGTRASDGSVSDYDVALPEIDELMITAATEKVEHISKRHSLASKDLSISKMLSLTGKLVVSVHNVAALALYFFGSTDTITGGVFTDQEFPEGITEGQRLAIPGGRKNITSLVITDDAMSPATLDLDTDYFIEDAAAAVIRFGDPSGFTQPFKATGEEGSSTAVGMITQRQYERSLLYKGINIADDDRNWIVELFKIQVEPAKEWNLLNTGNEPNKYEIGFECLKDNTVDVDAVLGQYGKAIRAD